MSFQLDKKQKVKEILKCGKDPSYFLNNYARISHPLRGLILNFNNHRRLYRMDDVIPSR